MAIEVVKAIEMGRETFLIIPGLTQKEARAFHGTAYNPAAGCFPDKPPKENPLMKPIKMVSIAILTLLGFMFATTHRVAAQTANPQPTSPKVTAIGEGHLEADVTVRVDVAHLAEWVANPNLEPNHDPAKLVPYLNGLALLGNYPEEIHTSQDHLRFHLQITPANKKVWVDLLGEPQSIRKPVIFSVGVEGQSPFDTVYDSNNQVPLTVISPKEGVIALIVVLVTLILLVWLARNTNIIREPGPKPAGGKLRPYNLGRTQMAFWFFLVYTSYVVIWLITDALDTITPSLLGLMGISAGTALKRSDDRFGQGRCECQSTPGSHG